MNYVCVCQTTSVVQKTFLVLDQSSVASKKIMFYFVYDFFSVLDDYYMLYAVVYHDFDIQLISRDKFRDHLFHLDVQSNIDFQRWQKANQRILKLFHDESPIFRVCFLCSIHFFC